MCLTFTIASIGLKQIDDHTGEIKKFFVAQNYRGKGVAAKLMNTLIKAASKHHLKNLYLGTVDTLHAAYGFYQKYGFSKISEKQLPSGFQIVPIDTVFFKVTLEGLQHKLSQIWD